MLGGGLAAYAAALELRESGLQVTIVARAPGASALNSGAWDLAATSRSSTEDWAEWPEAKVALREILRSREEHPYSVIGRGLGLDESSDFIHQALERAARTLPLEMSSSDSGAMAMVNDLGTVKPSAWVQSSMREADLRSWRRAKALVVGFEGFPKFRGEFIRRSLLEQQEKQPFSHLEFAGSLEMAVPGVSGRASLTAVEIAEALDREENFVAFGQELVGYLEGKVYDRILLPPLLGLENTRHIVEALGKITKLKVAETLATPMSVPGLRLHRAIERFFDHESFEKIEAEAVGFDAEGRKLKALYLHSEEQRHRLRASAFVLAGGKYLGGGIKRRRQWREPLFGLPIWLEGKLLKHQSMPQVTRRDPAISQPFLTAGLRINSFAQPLDGDGQIAYDNLFAAGAILTGFNPAQEHCAAGVSIATGAVAGRHASALS
ncbi:MAG TPA: FAD-binding protein [bacterium]|nr:FAD-binding protein [bacterium]